jgi:hypothetical protein
MKKLTTTMISLFLTATSFRADCPTPQWGYWWPQLTQILYNFSAQLSTTLLGRSVNYRPWN